MKQLTPLNLMSVSLLVLFCFMTATSGVLANTYRGYAHDAHYYRRRPVTLHQYFSEHPKVRSAAIGAGVGTAAGAVTGLLTGRGILRGSLIGAGAGAGVGLIRSSSVMQRHPIVKNVATGSIIGLGLGYAGGSHHGTTARATAVGAAVGLASGLLMHGL